MDKVQRFEIPADDMARVKNFYSSVFGWEIKDVPGMEYAMADSVKTDENRQPVGGTNVGIIKRNSTNASVTSITIAVDDAYEAVKKVGEGRRKGAEGEAEVPGHWLRRLH